MGNMIPAKAETSNPTTQTNVGRMELRSKDSNASSARKLRATESSIIETEISRVLKYVLNETPPYEIQLEDPVKRKSLLYGVDWQMDNDLRYQYIIGSRCMTIADEIHRIRW